MDQQELATILEKHGRWLAGDEAGERANLGGANLEGADLWQANLQEANLRGANLQGACFWHADLREANLVGTNLVTNNVWKAQLEGARLNWSSHILIAEILRQAAGDDVEKRKVAGLVLISRDWCWKQFLKLRDPLLDWALETLAPWAAGDKCAPNVLKHLAQQKGVERAC